MNRSILVLVLALICLGSVSAFPQLRQRNEKQVQTAEDELRKLWKRMTRYFQGIK